MIQHDPTTRLWLLNTPATSYAIHIGSNDAPRHVHWGPRLTLDQASSLLATLPANPTDGDPGAEEIAVEGGARFGAPSLAVRYPDGVRGFAWQFTDAVVDEGEDAAGSELRLRFTDRTRELAVTLHYRIHADSDVIERWVTVLAGEPVEIQRLDSASWTLPHLPDYRVTQVSGAWGREFQVNRSPVAVTETVSTSRLGISGHHANPWLMVDAGDATETYGDVYSGVLAWSGSWRITLRRDPFGRANWTGGFGHEGVSWNLAASESLTTPAFCGLHSQEGFGGTSRAWHAYIRKHVLTAPDAVRPVIFNSWEATEFDIDEALQMDLAEHAARLGAEVFVMDDGWFGARVSDQAGLGDWDPNPSRFPNGLKPLIDKVHSLGMKFGIWVEPEAVNPDSDLYRAHPDWVLHQSGRERTAQRNQLTLNMARPDVAEWTHAWLDTLLSGNDIAFLKWDMNKPFTEAGWPASDDPDRLWIDHVRNVYSILDRLRAAHPDVVVEGCASGGGRADLGMLGHVDQFWTSDNTDAAERVAMQYGFSQIYPACTMGAWVTDAPNNVTGRALPLRYRFHVSMAGALGLGGDLRKWTDDEMAWSAHFVAQYKRIRPIVHGGDLYRLTSPDDGTAALQYLSQDRDEVVVMLFQPTALKRRTAPIRLTALDPATEYEDVDTGARHQGAVLLARGLDALMSFDGTSELLHLRRVV